jgi:hypothetical protein
MLLTLLGDDVLMLLSGMGERNERLVWGMLLTLLGDDVLMLLSGMGERNERLV